MIRLILNNWIIIKNSDVLMAITYLISLLNISGEFLLECLCMIEIDLLQESVIGEIVSEFHLDIILSITGKHK